MMRGVDRKQVLVLITVVLAALPGFIHLPWWVAGVSIAGGCVHFMGRWKNSLYARLLSLALLGGTGFAIWTVFPSWFSGDAVLSFFVVVVFLKWGESSTRRDFLLLIFAAVVLACVGALYFESILCMFHMVIVTFALTLSLYALFGDERILPLRYIFGKAVVLLLLAIPLTLLFFLTFPRIPGPVWDLGLAFGLPIKAMIDRGDGQFGKVKSLQPGGIQRATEENENVLVAEFEGAVPFKSTLYWRGPVFWEFDGTDWSLPESWDNRNSLLQGAIRSQKRLDRVLRKKGTPVRYTLRVMPNGGRWLYGLDFPAASAPEAFISEEFQLLSIRRIDDQEPKFQMSSFLDYEAGDRLTPEQRQRGLAWPEGTNPRLLELGRELGQQHENPDDIVHHAVELLAAGGFSYDSSHLVAPGPDMLDRYFFDEKQGGAEYLAGSFVMLMRAAGVPARLVSGFRGGTIIALTNFVIVKQADAHAWLEVWNDARGWYRVEPKDIILPPGEKDAALEAPAPVQEESKVEMESPRQSAEQVKSTAPNPEKANPVSKPAGNNLFDNLLPDYASLLSGMQKWVIQYNPDRQVELLKGAGLKTGNWANLMISGALGGALLLGLYLAGAWWFNRPKRDVAAGAWAGFCTRMGKLGVPREIWECPRAYRDRVADQRPEMKEAVDDIINRYISIRFRDDGKKDEQQIFMRQVKRFLSMT